MKTQKKQLAATAAEEERKYRAPALEKGLDILELLARNGSPMTTSQMAATLSCSAWSWHWSIVAISSLLRKDAKATCLPTNSFHLASPKVLLALYWKLPCRS